MATIIVSVNTVSNRYPAGTVAGGIVIAIPGIGQQTVTEALYAATFSDVPVGSYVATAQAIDVDGNPLGELLTSAPFDVVDTTVGIDIPAAISITVQ